MEYFPTLAQVGRATMYVRNKLVIVFLIVNASRNINQCDVVLIVLAHRVVCGFGLAATPHAEWEEQGVSREMPRGLRMLA
jgi:hypothetical protein